MKDTVRLEIRLSRTLKQRLEAEAKTCEESLNTYLVMILGHRKRVRVNIPTEGGHYLGYK
jgi:predicted HicB family RNase H-like nuclease